MPTVYIRTFGGLTCALRLPDADREIVLPLTGVRTRQLFAYLVTYRERPHQRAALAGLLWPELPEARARRNLSHVLWRLQQTLAPGSQSAGPGQGLILADEASIGFNLSSDHWLDLAVFEAATGTVTVDQLADVDGLAEAVALYRGEFLADLYDDWTLAEQARLRARYQRVLELLIAHAKQAGDYRRALSYAELLVASSPLDEAAHRELMRLYGLLGQPTLALRQYESCRRLLAQELGCEPDPATVALAQALRARRPGAAPAFLPAAAPAFRPLALDPGAQLPLIGRAGERAALLRHLERALGGYGGVVLIHGEAGIGKTRLVQELAADAAWRGALVFSGSAADQDRQAAFGVLASALGPGLTPLRISQLVALLDPLWLAAARQAIPALQAALPELAALPAIAPRQAYLRLLEALTRLLLALSTIAPLVLVCEDLHGADPATFELLGYLVRRAPQQRMLVLVTYRDEQAAEQPATLAALRALDAAAVPTRIRLDRLDAAETGELLRHGLGSANVAAELEQDVYGRTDGNPLHVLETIRALYDEQALRLDARGYWRQSEAWGAPATPRSSRATIENRVARLDPDARQLLALASLLSPEEVDFNLLTAASPLSAAATMAALATLVQRQFLVETAPAYRFSHDLVRQTVAERLPPQQRIQLHRRIVRALERFAPERLPALAVHAAAGRLANKAVGYAHRAAQHAVAQLDHPTACELVSLALAQTAPLADAQRFELLALRAHALRLSGEPDRSLADLAAMLPLAGERREQQLRVALAQAVALPERGDFAAAERAAHRALELAGELQLQPERAAALTELAAVVSKRGQTAEASGYLQEAMKICRLHGDAPGEARVHLVLGDLLTGSGALDKARVALERALALQRAAHQQYDAATTLNALGLLYARQGRAEQGFACFAEALEYARTIGARGLEADLLNSSGIMQINVLGQCAAGLANLQEALSRFEQLDNQYEAAIVQLNMSSLYSLVLGDYATAGSLVERGLAVIERTGHTDAQAMGICQRAELAMAAGDLQTAQIHVARSMSLLTLGSIGLIVTRVYNAVAQLRLLQDDLPEALAWAERSCAACAVSALPVAAIRAQILRGRILLSSGRPHEALASIAPTMGPSGGVAARVAAYWQAEALRALGREEEARAALRRAHDLLMSTLEGFTPDQRRHSLETIPEHRAIVAALPG